MPAVNPTPVPGSNINPAGSGGQVNSSGSTDSNATADWWVFIQTVDIMYLRRNQYDSTTSSTVATPNATFNYLDVNMTVQTQASVYENANFSGDYYQMQDLLLQSQGATAGGFGVCGAVNTVSAGYIRRVVRKDANGNVLDPTGTCTRTINTQVDNLPGAYNAAFDTSTSVNGMLSQILGHAQVECPNFIPSLVNL
jgi:hypothetical protein